VDLTMAELTWYWTAAVGDSGVQALPRIGPARDGLRDAVARWGAKWSN